MHFRSCLIGVTLTGLLVSCRTVAPEPSAAAPVPAPAIIVPAAPVVTTSSSWVYRPTAERHAFVLSQRAVVTIRQDTTVRIDTISSRADVVFATVNSRIAGSLTAYLVGGGGREPAPVAGVRFPVALVAASPSVSEQAVFSAPAAAAACASPATTVAQSLRDLWFRSPDTMRVGTSWSDSAQFAICRDGIPLRLRVLRTFQVLRSAERDGRTLLAVLRTSRTELAGEGDQFGEHVSLTGSGSGELTYEIAPLTGEVLGGQGSSTLDLNFRSALRVQQVRQSSEILLTRAN